MAILIDLKNIQKVFRQGHLEVEVLRGISLKVKAGEFLAITGPSGSGKSTLLNIIGFLDLPTSGRYLFEGRPVAKRRSAELAALRNEKMGFVFQTFNLLPRVSALDNVLLPLLYARGDRHLMGPSARERGVLVLTKVGLAERLRHRPNELSGGEQQRMAIARALVNRPAVILADEPTGNLDSKAGEAVIKIFENLNREGTTVILVTHNLGLTKKADRVVCLKDGRLAAKAPYKEKLRRGKV